MHVCNSEEMLGRQAFFSFVYFHNQLLFLTQICGEIKMIFGQSICILIFKKSILFSLLVKKTYKTQ